MHDRSSGGVLLFFALALSAFSRAAPAELLDIVAEVGAAAPAPAAPATWAALGEPRIGGNDAIAFVADLSDGNTAHTVADESLWVGEPGALALLAREDQPAPGTEANTVFAAFADARYVVTPSGEVAFFATLKNAVTPLAATNDSAFFAGTPDNLRILAREGDVPAGVPATTWSDAFGFGVAPVYTAGGLALRAQATPGSVVGIWTGLASPLALAVRTGVPAPWEPANVTGLQAPLIDSTGHLAFVAQSPAVRIVTGLPGALAIFVATGSSPPPGGQQLTIATTSALGVNGAGKLAFTASLTATGEAALLAGTPSDLPVLAFQHQQVPGAAAGTQFVGFLAPVLVNEPGTVVFGASYAGTESGNGLFTGGTGPVQAVARSDQGLPGHPTAIGAISGRCVNAAGEIAFFASGLWRASGSDVHLIAEPGMTFDGGATGTRTFSSVTAPSSATGSGSQDGRASFLADTGRIVFRGVLQPSHTTILVTHTRATGIPALPRLALLGLAALLPLYMIAAWRRGRTRASWR